MLERVTEAERVAVKQLKEMQATENGRGKKRGRGDDEEVDDGEENAETIVQNALKKRSKTKRNKRTH